MIHLCFVRHGIAGPRSRHVPDQARALTHEGRKRARKLARTLARVARLRLVFTSPLVRAVQTAEILAGELPGVRVAVLAQLSPGHSPAQLLAALARRRGGAKGMALVGHEPLLSQTVARLTGRAAQDLRIRKGMAMRLDVSGLPSPVRVLPRFFLSPRSARLHEGLPVPAGEGPRARAAGGRSAGPSRTPRVALKWPGAR